MRSTLACLLARGMGLLTLARRPTPVARECLSAWPLEGVECATCSPESAFAVTPRTNTPARYKRDLRHDSGLPCALQQSAWVEGQRSFATNTSLDRNNNTTRCPAPSPSDYGYFASPCIRVCAIPFHGPSIQSSLLPHSQRSSGRYPSHACAHCESRLLCDTSARCGPGGVHS